MKSVFSQKWKASRQPRKQRKFIANAPLHVKKIFASSHLDKELAKQYNARTLRVRTGDKVKILRGSFKGKEGNIASVDRSNALAFINGIEVQKRNGTVAQPGIHTSNLLILNLAGGDKRRLKRKQEVKNESTS